MILFDFLSFGSHVFLGFSLTKLFEVVKDGLFVRVGPGSKDVNYVRQREGFLFEESLGEAIVKSDE